MRNSINVFFIYFIYFEYFQSPEPSGIIDLRSFHVTEGNYTKRKHVFKLASAAVSNSNLTSPTTATTNNSNLSASTELLIQTENQHDMKHWMDSLRTACNNEVSFLSGILFRFLISLSLIIKS